MMSHENDVSKIGSIALIEEIALCDETLISAYMMDEADKEPNIRVFFSFDNAIISIAPDAFDELAEIMHNYHLSKLKLSGAL